MIVLKLGFKLHGATVVASERGEAAKKKKKKAKIVFLFFFLGIFKSLKLLLTWSILMAKLKFVLTS